MGASHLYMNQETNPNLFYSTITDQTIPSNSYYSIIKQVKYHCIKLQIIENYYSINYM